MKIKSDRPSEVITHIKQVLLTILNIIPKSLIFKWILILVIIVLAAQIWHDYSGPIGIWMCMIAIPVVFARDIVSQISIMIFAGAIVASFSTADVYTKKYPNIPIEIKKIEFVDVTEKIIIQTNLPKETVVLAPGTDTYFAMKEHKDKLKIYLMHEGKLDQYDKMHNIVSEHNYYVFANYGKDDVRISGVNEAYATGNTEQFNDLK